MRKDFYGSLPGRASVRKTYKKLGLCNVPSGLGCWPTWRRLGRGSRNWTCDSAPLFSHANSVHTWQYIDKAESVQAGRKKNYVVLQPAPPVLQPLNAVKPPPHSQKKWYICRKELIDGYLRKLTLKRYSSCALSLSKKLPSGLPSRSASASYLKIVFVTVLCLNSLLNISTCPFSPSKKSSQLFGRGQAPSDERSPPDFGLS